MEHFVKISQALPGGRCGLCDVQLLPDDPEDVVLQGTHAKHLEYLYCGHYYHYGCLDKYINSPPFQDGKPCKVCGRRIWHHKFCRDTKLLEDRWAHKKAREREIKDVTDFLGF